MVIIPEYPSQSNTDNETRLRTFKAIKEMKKILGGDRGVITRIDEEKMEEVTEYLCSSNEGEFVEELINNKFSWIIQLGSAISVIFSGKYINNNKIGNISASSSNNYWELSNLVPEFIGDTIYQFFECLLRHPEEHANASNINHLMCTFWPYSTWAYKQLVDKVLKEEKEWTNSLENATKAIWSSYNVRLYRQSRRSNIDYGKRSMYEYASDRDDLFYSLLHSANKILDNFRKIALSAIEEAGIPYPRISVLYYNLELDQRLSARSSLIPIKNDFVSIDDLILAKSEVNSDMWQIETNLLVPMAFKRPEETLNHLDKVCQGFFR